MNETLIKKGLTENTPDIDSDILKYKNIIAPIKDNREQVINKKRKNNINMERNTDKHDIELSNRYEILSNTDESEDETNSEMETTNHTHEKEETNKPKKKRRKYHH